MLFQKPGSAKTDMLFQFKRRKDAAVKHKKMGAFSPERLFNIRRLRKARRHWKKEPLLAYASMCELYPGYRPTSNLQKIYAGGRRKKKKTL